MTFGSPRMYLHKTWILKKGKVKVYPRKGHEGPRGEWRDSFTLSLTSALDGGGWSTPRPCRFIPGKETRYPLYRRLCGPQGRSGRVRKISPSPGFDPSPASSRSLYWLRYPGPQNSCPYCEKRQTPNHLYYAHTLRTIMKFTKRTFSERKR